MDHRCLCQIGVTRPTIPCLHMPSGPVKSIVDRWTGLQTTQPKVTLCHYSRDSEFSTRKTLHSNKVGLQLFTNYLIKFNFALFWHRCDLSFYQQFLTHIMWSCLPYLSIAFSSSFCCFTLVEVFLYKLNYLWIKQQYLELYMSEYFAIFFCFHYKIHFS